jgi:predicted  nucleic acid-binding Zn-ribbon protein
VGTIRSLEATVQGFEERAARLDSDIADANKRAKEFQSKIGARFEREERYQELCRRQAEIEDKLDLTKNQAPSQADATSNEIQEKAAERETQAETVRPAKRVAVRV